MKIAIICDVLGVPNNGTSIAAFNLINFLKKQGHEVHVICADKDKKGLENYHIVPTLNLGLLNKYVAKNDVVLAKADRRIMEPVIKEMDAIHTVSPFVLSKAAVKIAKKYNIPVTSSCHAQAENFTAHVFLMHSHLANAITYRVYYNTVYKYAEAVHYPSQFICDYLLKRHYSKPTPYVITNGVNPGIFPIQTEKPEKYKGKFVILYTARYSKEKNHRVLIDAMKYSKYADKIQIIFAGSGPQKTTLMKRAQKRHLHNQPEFSFFKREEMNQIVNFADLYVHPSNIEIEAIACNEAVSCGLVPVISNSKKSAATMFALDQNNLFKASNPRDLAKKIDFWIENPSLKKTQKELYLKKRNPDSVEQAMHKMEKMIFDAMKMHQNKKENDGTKHKTN